MNGKIDRILQLIINTKINSNNIFISFIHGYMLSLSNLREFFNSKKHLYLNNPENLNQFYGILENYVGCADAIEDTFNDLNLNGNNTFFELLKLVVQLRSLCLTYLSDFGYQRKRNIYKNEKSLMR